MEHPQITYEDLVRMLDRVEADMLEADRHRKVGQTMYQLMSKHYDHKEHWMLDRYLQKVGCDSLLMAVRRQMDDDRRTASLLRVLREIRNSPLELRGQFKNKFDHKDVTADLERIELMRTDELRVVDERIAHNKLDYVHKPQIKPYDAYLDSMLEILSRCLFIVKDSDVPIPVMEPEWTSIFNIAWNADR